MRRCDLNEFGLTVVEERFVNLIAQGWTRRLAAKKADPEGKRTNKALDSWSSRTCNKVQVHERLMGLLNAVKISDRDSEGRWHADLLVLIDTSVLAVNLTAAAQFMRMRGQALGVLKDRVIVATEHTMTDAELVATLAGDDKAKAATLHAVIGTATFGTDEAKKAA